MRAEKDVRLRIDLLDGQSNSITELLAKALRERNEEAYTDYSQKLGIIRGKIEELLWILGEKTQFSSTLDLYVVIGNNERIKLGQLLDLLKLGRVQMSDLTQEVQALVRKGALELKKVQENAKN